MPPPLSIRGTRGVFLVPCALAAVVGACDGSLLEVGQEDSGSSIEQASDADIYGSGSLQDRLGIDVHDHDADHADADHTHTVGPHAHEVVVDVRDAEFEPETGHLILATSEGIFRVDPQTAELTELHPDVDVSDVVMNPFLSETLWGSGTWANDGEAGWSFGESDDGGRSWSTVSLEDYDQFDAVAASTEIAGFIAAHTADALYVSTDAGRSWTRFERDADVSAMQVASHEPTTIFVAGGSGVVRVTLDTLEAELVFAAPTSSLDRWMNGYVLSFAGAILACDDELGECESLFPPSSKPMRSVLVIDSLEGIIYALDSQSTLHVSIDRTSPWQRIPLDFDPFVEDD